VLVFGIIPFLIIALHNSDPGANKWGPNPKGDAMQVQDIAIKWGIALFVAFPVASILLLGLLRFLGSKPNS
jgi:hypothetical protein